MVVSPFSSCNFLYYILADPHEQHGCQMEIMTTTAITDKDTLGLHHLGPPTRTVSTYPSDIPFALHQSSRTTVHQSLRHTLHLSSQKDNSLSSPSFPGHPVADSASACLHESNEPPTSEWDLHPEPIKDRSCLDTCQSRNTA
jgi:hypothetical protein